MTHLEIPALAFVAAVSFGMSYAGAAVGLVLGQLRVPLLTYVLGSAAEATATSLAISTVATIIGAVAHARQARVQLALLLTVGTPSAAAAYVATRYAGVIDPLVLRSAIALTIVVSGVHMLWRARAHAHPPSAAASRLLPRALVVALEIAVGALLGAVSGLVGLLLGSLRLPAMMRLVRGVPPATAVGTNMAIGALTGLSAGLSAFTGGHLNISAFACVAPLTLLGSHLGAQRTGKLDDAALSRWIAYVLIPTGLMMFGEIGLRLAHAGR